MGTGCGLQAAMVLSGAEAAEENLAELAAQANAFAEKQLPVRKALQIA